MGTAGWANSITAHSDLDGDHMQDVLARLSGGALHGYFGTGDGQPLSAAEDRSCDYIYPDIDITSNEPTSWAAADELGRGRRDRQRIRHSIGPGHPA